jgi:hypothetical protein
MEGSQANAKEHAAAHSGFGLIDRLWYPYARTREPPPDLDAIVALTRVLDAALPNHVYRVEQTARVYTIRGDLWDYLYDRRRAAGSGTFISLTLEVSHRHRRTLRRHMPLLELLLHATASFRRWLP